MNRSEVRILALIAGLTGAAGLQAGAYVADGLPTNVNRMVTRSSWVKTLTALDAAIEAMSGRTQGLPVGDITIAGSNEGGWFSSTYWEYQVVRGSETDRILSQVRSLITDRLIEDDDDDSSYDPYTTLGVDDGDGILDVSEDDEKVSAKLKKARKEAVYSGTGVDRGYAHGLKGSWADKVRVNQNENWASFGDDIQQRNARASAARSWGKDANDLVSALRDAKEAMTNQRNRVDRNYVPVLKRLVDALNTYDESQINASRRPGYGMARSVELDDDTFKLFFPTEYDNLEYPGAEDDKKPSQRFRIRDGYLIATYAGLAYKLAGAPDPDSSTGDGNQGDQSQTQNASGDQSQRQNASGDTIQLSNVPPAERVNDNAAGDAGLGQGDQSQNQNASGDQSQRQNASGDQSQRQNASGDQSQRQNASGDQSQRQNASGDGTGTGVSASRIRSQQNAKALVPWLLSLQSGVTGNNYQGAGPAAVAALASAGAVIGSGFTGNDGANVRTNGDVTPGPGSSGDQSQNQNASGDQSQNQNASGDQTSQSDPTLLLKINADELNQYVTSGNTQDGSRALNFFTGATTGTQGALNIAAVADKVEEAVQRAEALVAQLPEANRAAAQASLLELQQAHIVFSGKITDLQREQTAPNALAAMQALVALNEKMAPFRTPPTA